MLIAQRSVDYIILRGFHGIGQTQLFLYLQFTYGLGCLYSTNNAKLPLRFLLNYIVGPTCQNRGATQWRIYNVRKEGAQEVWGMEVPQ